MDDVFKYPADLVAALRGEGGRITWRGVTVEPLPPAGALLALAETCYFASLTVEEGRATTFKVFEGLGAPFDSEVPVTVQALRRLAPAAPTQSLGLRVGTTHADSAIWGFASAPSDFGLRMEVSGPGRLQIGNPLTAWLALDGGKVEAPGRGAATVANNVFEPAFRDLMTPWPIR